MSKQSELIILRDIKKTYQIGGVATVILKYISLTITAGELVAIVGASGSGKSTLMHIIGLLDEACQGEYLLQQQNIATCSEDEKAQLRNHLGFIFQQFHLLKHFNVWQNVALPLHYRQTSLADSKERSMLALEEVGLLNFANQKPAQLSGGQQQRVAIARALVTSPKIILADEPTGALDSRTGKEIMDLFIRLNTAGHTIIIVTHDEQIAKRCRRRISLADGEIVDEKHYE